MSTSALRFLVLLTVLVAWLPAAQPFLESGGCVVMEVESAPLAGSWTAETYRAGYTGSGFREWKKGNAATSTDAAGTGILSYPITISTAGRYRLQIRSQPAHNTEHNDVWVRVLGATKVEAVRTNGTDPRNLGTAWTKSYNNTAGSWTWNTNTVDHDPHAIYAEFTAGAAATVELSGRSTQFCVDRIVLYTSAFTEAQATSTSVPESPRATGGGTPAVSISGEVKQWHNVIITVPGPASSETSTPNPFRDYRLDVTFTAPGGAVRTVPGYFAADGNAHETSATSGSLWRAHLSPHLTGTWSYAVSFKTGTNVAINGGGASAGANDGATGTFTVSASDKTGADFRAADKGRLEYVGEHALRWRGGGGRFFKTAMNHPEVLLEYQDFDNTDSTRTYPDHVANWTSGDPTWKATKGKGIIGVVNYLAGQGVNEHYFLTMNSRGDGKKAFPWTAAEAKWNYDVSKLAQWGLIFEHMMRKGVMPQFVLDECENQMLFEVLDGTPAGGIADSRKLYYREMAARFGHLNAAVWNIGEENGWDRTGAGAGPSGAPTNEAQRKSRAAWLRGLLSPQAHIVVHNGPSNTDAIFTGLVGDAGYSGISYQGNLSNTVHGNGRIGYWHTQSRNAGRRWVIAYDEPYLSGTPSREEWRTNALWASLSGGATGAGIYSSSDLSLQNYTSYASHFGDMRRAHTFLSLANVPYWDMVANNALVTAGWCLAKSGSDYVVYLPTGGTASLNLSGQTGTYDVRWFNPRAGSALQNGSVTSVTGGGSRALGNPPADTALDWVVSVKLSGVTPPPNVAPTVTITTPTNGASFTAPANIAAAATASDSDGTVSKVEFFVGGVLRHTENIAPYDFAWNAVPAGTYQLTARATDDDGATTTSAAITVTVTAGTTPPPTTPAAPTVTGNGTATPTLSGVTQPGAVVHIFANGVEIGTVTAAGDGSWSYTVSGLPAGSHLITVTAQNAGGTSPASPPLTVTVSGAGGGGGGSGSSGGESGGSCGLGAVSAMLLLMMMALFVRRP